MVEKVTKAAGHGRDMLLFASQYSCDVVALQETRRDGRTTFQAPTSGYVPSTAAVTAMETGETVNAESGTCGQGVYRQRARPGRSHPRVQQYEGVEGATSLLTWRCHDLHHGVCLY